MVKYIEVTNNQNVTQINDTFQNLTLLRKFKISDWKRFNNTWSADIITPEFPSLLFVHNPSNENVGMFYVVARFDSHKPVKRVYVETASGNKPDFLEFFVFGCGDNIPTGYCGVQVYNADNVCIFDSNKKYLNITQLIYPTNNVEGSYTENGPMTLDSAIKHAICVPAQASYVRIQGGLSIELYHLYLWIAPHTQSIWGEWKLTQYSSIGDTEDGDQHLGVTPMWIGANVTNY